MSIWVALISIKYFKKEKHSSHVSVKNEGRIYKKKMPTVFPAIFPAKQTTQSPDLNGHTMRKNANKKNSKQCEVISNFG